MAGELFDMVEDWHKGEREYRETAAQIHAALGTPAGRALKEWLADACFMNTPMLNSEIESAAQTQRIAARRDLFIALTQMEKEGSVYVTGDSN